MIRRVSLLGLVALAAAIVLMPTAAAGGGCHAPVDLEMSSGTNPEIAIGECSFIDTVVYVEPGQEVRWINKDPVPHTVTGAAYSWGTDRYLNQSDEVAYTFEKDGVYPYYCALHPSMVGAVVVGDATVPAAITNGMADVQEAAALPPPTEPTSGSGDGASSALIALAIAVTAAMVILAARTLSIRRRATSATPAP